MSNDQKRRGMVGVANNIEVLTEAFERLGNAGALPTSATTALNKYLRQEEEKRRDRVVEQFKRNHPEL